MRKTLLTLGIAGAALLAPATAANAAAPHLTCAKAAVVAIATGTGSWQSSTTGPDCTVLITSWSLPDTYNGKGHTDPSAHPQKRFDIITPTLTGTPQMTTVKLPPSRWCQIDYRAAGGKYVYGAIVECHPPKVTPPPSTVTPKPPVVKHPKPKPHHHAPAPKPVTHVRLTASTTPAALPRTGGLYTAGVEGGAALVLMGLALYLAAGFRQSGPTHRNLG